VVLLRVGAAAVATTVIMGVFCSRLKEGVGRQCGGGGYGSRLFSCSWLAWVVLLRLLLLLLLLLLRSPHRQRPFFFYSTKRRMMIALASRLTGKSAG
jgi:hypothetical protein